MTIEFSGTKTIYAFLGAKLLKSLTQALHSEDDYPMLSAMRALGSTTPDEVSQVMANKGLCDTEQEQQHAQRGIEDIAHICRYIDSFSTQKKGSKGHGDYLALAEVLDRGLSIFPNMLAASSDFMSDSAAHEAIQTSTRRAGQESAAIRGANKKAGMAWYKEHKADFKTKDEAAQVVADKFYVSFSTARSWIKGG